MTNLQPCDTSFFFLPLQRSQNQQSWGLIHFQSAQAQEYNFLKGKYQYPACALCMISDINSLLIRKDDMQET